MQEITKEYMTIRKYRAQKDMIDPIEVKPTAHDASFLAGSLAGRFYAGCAALSQAGRNVGLVSYGAGCRAYRHAVFRL